MPICLKTMAQGAQIEEVDGSDNKEIEGRDPQNSKKKGNAHISVNAWPSGVNLFHARQAQGLTVAEKHCDVYDRM